MAHGQAYTDDDLATLKQMVSEKKPFEEIGAALERSKTSVSQKWYEISRVRKSPPAKSVKTIDKESSPPPVQEEYRRAPPVERHHRPMIALIGTPDEVKTTLKELFS